MDGNQDRSFSICVLLEDGKYSKSKKKTTHILLQMSSLLV